MAAPASRLQSIDALRGAIMVLMAIDHIRDFVDRSAQQFLPTDLTRTTPALFFTRWITHFCAPVFFLTAGLGAYLWMSRGHHSRRELSRLLVTRGLWLIVLEITLLRVVFFSQISYTADPVILLILWAIGLSMIALAALVHLPMPVTATVGVAIVVFHNLLDPIRDQRFGRMGWLWDILHQQNAIPVHGVVFVTGYPVLPWIGVIACGYCLGTVFEWHPARRRQLLTRLGIGLVVIFFVLRAINHYGDPQPWTHQASPVFTTLSFFDVTKYPPSLDFLSMTLGPALIALAWLERFQFSSSNPLIVFGRVPFFYYAAHLFLAHALTIALNFARYGAHVFLLLAPPAMGSPAKLFPPGFGFPLWTTFAVWLIVLLLLYPACLWFARLKQRRHDWWLTYL